MQTTVGSGGRDQFVPEPRERRLSRLIAIALAVAALGFGVDGLVSLTSEMWGVGLIGFGCLLAVLSVLAQSAEHFARAEHSR
jgi:hypothetical protein